MKRRWLRWTVPPSVSLLVHASLLALVAYIGARISAEQTPSQRVRVTELALPAPPVVPDQPDADATPAHTPSPVAPPPATQPPDAVQTQARALHHASPGSAPGIDPVTLEAMRRASATIARPESTSPPSVAFAGVRSRAARTLVYVVDGSGATANSFAYLQKQLMRSIDRLSPTQRFQVVLFRAHDETRYEMAPINGGRLARATPEHKQRVARWLDTVATRGRSNPLDGLEAALALRPDLVLLITRSIQRTEMGWAQGQREILRTLDKLNPRDERTGQRATTIKCVQLLDDDPTGIMQAIGGLHGDGEGDYRVVRYEDLIRDDNSETIEQRSIGASDEQRIASALQAWSGLTQAGITQRVLTSVVDDQQRERAIETARGVRTLLASLRRRDGRAELLWAQATLVLRRAQSRGDRPGDDELRQIIDRLADVVYTDPSTDAQRIIAVALARGELGQTSRATAELNELIRDSDELGLDPLTRAQTLLALVSLGEEPESLAELARGQPFTTASGGIDALWGLLLREGVTIARLRTGAGNAWTPMLRVRESAAGNEAISAYIDQRLALIHEAYGAEDADTPAPVLMAAGDALSRSVGTRQRAMALYERVAGGEDPQLRAEALWRIGVLGRAINTPASLARSNAALTELATDFPDDPRAMDAISSAIGAGAGTDEDTLRRRLELGVERFPDSPAIDLWRLRLAELSTGFARLDTLDLITPGTREGVLAGQLYEQTVQEMLEEYDDPQLRLGLTRRVSEAASRFDLPSALMWTKRLAIAEAAHDPSAALERIDTMIEQAEADGDPSEELRLLRAQTLLRLGQTRSAFDALRELSERIDASGRRTSTYWQSWALMLEAVAAHGDERDRAEARRHLARLRLIDPELGGSPWNHRLQEAGKTLHSEP